MSSLEPAIANEMPSNLPTDALLRGSLDPSAPAVHAINTTLRLPDFETKNSYLKSLWAQIEFQGDWNSNPNAFTVLFKRFRQYKSRPQPWQRPHGLMDRATKSPRCLIAYMQFSKYDLFDADGGVAVPCALCREHGAPCIGVSWFPGADLGEFKEGGTSKRWVLVKR